MTSDNSNIQEEILKAIYLKDNNYDDSGDIHFSQYEDKPSQTENENNDDNHNCSPGTGVARADPNSNEPIDLLTGLFDQNIHDLSTIDESYLQETSTDLPQPNTTAIFKNNEVQNTNKKIIYGQRTNTTSVFKRFQRHPKVNSEVTTPLVNVRRSLFNADTYFPEQSITTNQNFIFGQQNNTVYNPYSKTNNKNNQNGAIDNNNKNLSNTNERNNSKDAHQKTPENETPNDPMVANTKDTTSTKDTATTNTNNSVDREIHNGMNLQEANLSNILTSLTTNPILFRQLLQQIHPEPHHYPNINSHSNNPPNQTRNVPPTTQNNITLPPELEPLRTVIMSQHKAFEKHIKELGKICLNFTNLIEKKRESSSKLFNDTRIPRSLKINCSLTTSPSYEEEQEYINLKQELQNIVRRFQNDGLEVMKKWSLVNIRLLIKDRCHNILSKAIEILDGLILYWENILSPIQWPPAIQNNILILLFKIYFTTKYVTDSEAIIKYLDLPTETILLTATSLITKQKDTNHNIQLLESISLNFLQNQDVTQMSFIMETLLAFDSILKATMVQLWEINSQQMRELDAAQKLKAKLETNRITSATTATAKAINKAVSQINEDNTIAQINHLRISNLEKQLLHQKQTSQEILKHIKSHKQQKQDYPTPQPNPFSSNQELLIDLTKNLSQSPEPKKPPHNQSNKKRKNIYWDDSDAQITRYHPESTPRQTFTNQFGMTPDNLYEQFSKNPIHINPNLNQPISQGHNNQMFAKSTTLHPFQLTPNQPHPPYNPFISPYHNSHQRNHAGRRRGGRRGSRTK
jgi:hypothetical protein